MSFDSVVCDTQSTTPTIYLIFSSALTDGQLPLSPSSSLRLRSRTRSPSAGITVNMPYHSQSGDQYYKDHSYQQFYQSDQRSHSFQTYTTPNLCGHRMTRNTNSTSTPHATMAILPYHTHLVTHAFKSVSMRLPHPSQLQPLPICEEPSHSKSGSLKRRPLVLIAPRPSGGEEPPRSYAADQSAATG